MSFESELAQLRATKKQEQAKAIAEAISNEWSVGTSSVFCDDPPDFDRATIEEIVALILPLL